MENGLHKAFNQKTQIYIIHKAIVANNHLLALPVKRQRDAWETWC